MTESVMKQKASHVGLGFGYGEREVCGECTCRECGINTEKKTTIALLVGLIVPIKYYFNAVVRMSVFRLNKRFLI